MKKNILLSLFAALLVVLVNPMRSVGQISSWALTSDGSASGVAANMSATDFVSLGTSAITFGTTGAYADGWVTGALSTSDYFEVSIAPDAGFAINVTAINFGERRSGTGPRDYQVRWSVNNFTASTTIATVNVPDNTNERSGNITGLNIDVADGETLKIRWYGYNAEAGTGTWRINDGTLNIEGTVNAASSNTITTGTSLTGSPFCVGTAIGGASVSVPYTTSGTFNGGNVFTAQLSNAAGNFASPTDIGTGASPISATIPAAAAEGIGYRIRVVGSAPVTNGANNGTDLVINNFAAPTTLAVNCGNTTADASWTNPGCFDDVMVVAKASAFTSALPSAPPTVYTADASFTGTGSVFDGGKVVFKASSGSSETVTDLTNGTTYYFKIFARKGGTWVAGSVESCAPVAGPLWQNPITGTDPNTSNPYTIGDVLGSLNITVSGIGRGSDISGSSASNRYNASGWTTSTSIDANDYFEFTLTPNAGYEIDFTNFIFTGQASGSGPTEAAFRSSADGYAANIGSTSPSGSTISLSGAAYQNINSAITFRLYGYDAGAGAGTFSVNDFEFNGVVSPGLPSVTLSINPLSGSENTSGTDITLKAEATIPVTGDQTVAIELSVGSTADAADFNVTLPTTITISNNQTIGYATAFRVVDDLLNEGSETATFTITGITSGGTPATIGTTDHVDLPITDNDNVYSSLSVIDGQGGEAANISSLTNGFILNNTQGTQVWNFNLYDGNGVANDADDKPTVYEQWVIRPDGVNNTVPDWDAAIFRVAFFSGSTIIPGSPLINAGSISFVPGTPISVGDGTTPVQISMRITLENTLPANSDGQHFAFSLDDSDVTVDLTTTSYSQLGAFTEVSNAALNGIDILATLQFINAPTAVSVGSNFSVTVSAVDANGNVDTGVSNSITLSLTSGTGTLTGAPVTTNLTSGTHIFTGLNHDTEEVITITVHDNGNMFANLTANINVTNEPYQLFDDFNRADNNTVGIPSSETVTTYNETGTGDGSRQRILNNQLLLSNCNSTGGVSSNGFERVMFNVENRHETVFDNAGSSMEWIFNMQQERSDPSGFGSNTYGIGVILGANQINVDVAGANGYAVIIGNSSAGDPKPVKLVRFTNGLTTNANVTDVAVSSQLQYNNYFSVKVTFNPCTGQWALYVRNDGVAAFAAPNVGSLGSAVTGTDQTHTASDLKYFGFVWQHGSSCSEEALFDNVNIPNASSATTTSKLWNGSISADWNVAGNWGPCPGVPTNLQNVIIPNVATQPIVMNATPATCKDLTVNAGADLTINATRFLNVWGNVLNNGAAAFGAGTLTMEGAGTLTLTGNVTVANYHVSTNVTLNGTVTISDIARSEVGGVLAANGNLVLLNGAQLLHGVGTPNGGGSVSGNIVVKRQGNSTTLFNAWATPVVGGALPGSNGYLYNSLSGTNSNLDDNVLAPDGGWAPHSGAMAAGVGYFSTNGGLATFTGVPNNGNYAPTVTGSNQGLSSQTAPSFFNLVGNPYPSAINANLFISQNSTPLDGALYFWNDQDNTFTSTDYATYTTAGGVPAAGSPLEEPNGSIPSCQGFFVNCRTGNDTPIALNFNNGQRGGNNSQFFRMAAPDYQRMWISINNTNLNLFNQTLVGFDEFATDQKDWGVDAYKFRGNQDISIGAQQDGETYVIATYETIPQSGKIVPLMTYVQTAGMYTFVADSMEGFENHTVYLEDLSNGSLYPLEQGDSYSFNMTSADEFGRFQLWFSPLTITGMDEAANDLRIYAANDMVVVENTAGESTKGTVQITDMAGRMVLTNDLTITNGIGRLQTANLTNGIYAVSFVSMNGNQSIAQKVTLGQ